MKKKLKFLLYLFGGIITIALLTLGGFSIYFSYKSKKNLSLLGDPAPTLFTKIDSFKYRDLNKNGKLDVYEDPRANINDRVENLLSQMTLEEKAGTMFITMMSVSETGTMNEAPSITNPITFAFPINSEQIALKKMNHFNIFQSHSPYIMIEWHNAIQKAAERTRLGIPITIASDPRHGTANENIGASIPTPFFSKWCTPLGFGAIGDPKIVEEFGNIARQEYRVVGITLALHPMADLATEPRWARISGTFGEDALLSAKLTKAYINGFQTGEVGANDVACMVKHFPGGGPQKDGEDAHFPYGKDQAYPGNNFNYHLIPFEKGAFPAQSASIMPYYGVGIGQTNENVGFGYNKEVITEMLRNKYGFEGIVCTDWGLVSSHYKRPAASYGVENLTEKDRVLKIIDAGCDMLGGEETPQWIVDLVKEGKLSEKRINKSLRRILKLKFQLGLFDNPYLEKLNVKFLQNKNAIEKGKEAQRKSLVLAKNNDNILPLKEGIKVFTYGFNKESIEPYASVVDDIKSCDVILMHLKTPYEARDEYILERFFHQGSLAFTEEKKNEILAMVKQKPTIIVFSMDRPAVFPKINNQIQGLVIDFFCQEDIQMELLFGKFSPSGKLPFEIPSSMDAVKNQKEDVPYDSKNPLYKFGHGLTYTKN